jgi:hypothetical protein
MSQFISFEALGCPAVFRPQYAVPRATAAGEHPPATVAACCAEVRSLEASGRNETNSSPDFSVYCMAKSEGV